MKSCKLLKDRTRIQIFRLVMCLLLIVSAQTTVALSQSSVLNQAIADYDDAEFDKAIPLFLKIAADPTADVEERMEAYQFLTRLYVAKQMENEARESINDLLELEPPLAQFDSNAEPLSLMNLYYNARKEKTGGYEVEKANSKIQTIAILDFRDGSFGSTKEDYSGLSAHLASKMINFLNGSVDLVVVERERLNFILNELKLQRDGNIVDQQTAVRVGKLMGAQSVIFGNYAVIKNKIDIGVRMVKVETSEVLLGADVNGKLDDVFKLTKELSQKIAKAINVSLDDDVIDAIGESRNLDAMMSYQEGVRLLEQNQIASAYNKFQEALGYDPSYAQAALRVTSLKHSLN